MEVAFIFKIAHLFGSFSIEAYALTFAIACTRVEKSCEYCDTVNI